jgi:hypothetical protein
MAPGCFSQSTAVSHSRAEIEDEATHPAASIRLRAVELLHVGLETRWHVLAEQLNIATASLPEGRDWIT